MSSIIRKVLNRVERYAVVDAFIILEASFDNQFNNDIGTVNKISSAEKIKTVYASAGRERITLSTTIKSRINHGLDFYTYAIDNEIIAFTWMLSNVSRFIDELGISVDSTPRSLWVRDVFVLENHRGKNIFSTFLSKIVSDFYQGNIDTLRSDIYQSNNSSFQAHKKYGFKPICKVNYLVVLNKILIRLLPKTKIKMSVFREGQSIIKMDAIFKKHVTENMA